MSEPKVRVPRGVRFLALVLGLGGLVGLGVVMGLQISALRDADFRPSLVIALLGIPGTLFALSLWAGYDLWDGKPRAVTLAKVLFALQIPNIAFPGFAYHFFTGGIISLAVTHETEARLEYQAQLGSNMGFTFSAEQQIFAIGINFVALFAFMYLMRSSSRGHSPSLKAFGNAAGLLVIAIALCCSSFAQTSQTGAAGSADSTQLRVCCRPLPLWSGSQALALKSLNGLIVRRLHHCFLDFGSGAAVSETGIPIHTSGIHPLEPDNRNKQPMLDQATDNIDSGGVCQVVKDATPDHIRQIEDELSLNTCYSCGSNYHNRVGTAHYNNSNSYAYDMVRDAGLKPPSMHGAPGYHTHSADVKLDPDPVRDDNNFIGLGALSSFAKTARAELLAYDNNGNRLHLYRNGEIVPLNLHTLLWTPRSCCAHRATPARSHRTSRLAYVHLLSVQPRTEAIGIYDFETRTQKDIFEATAIWGISWSRDDSRVAVIADSGTGSGPNVYLIELDTGAATRVTPGTLQVDGITYTTSDYSPPSWSNSGTELAIEVRRRGAGAGNSDAGAIIVWDLETGRFHKLSDGVAPSWSPASDRIAFYDRSRQSCYTIRPNGQDKQLLFSLREHTFGSGRAPLLYPLVWLDDGSSVIFHQWVDADLITDVYRLDLHTGKAKKLARSELQLVDLRQKAQ